MSETVHELPGTAVPHRAASRRTRAAEPAEQLEVSVYLKPPGKPGFAAGDALARRRCPSRLHRRCALAPPAPARVKGS